MHLDHQAVGAAGRGSQGHGLHISGCACRVAGVHHHRQVAQLMQHRHRRQVQRVPGIRLKGSHPALAQDHLLVSAGHDVLGAHQQFLDIVGQAALEQDRFVNPAQFLQQFKVLHVPCAHLDNVHILKQRKMCNIHDFGDDRQAGQLLDLGQDQDAFLMEPLEIIG